MNRKVIMTAITAITLGVAACTPSESPDSINGVPTCNQAPSTSDCIKVVQLDQGNGSGWLVKVNGESVPVTFWADGTIDFPGE